MMVFFQALVSCFCDDGISVVECHEHSIFELGFNFGWI